MKGVPRELAEHSLNIDPKFKPVKQPLRRFGDDKRRAIGKEIARLLKARFIREVLHTQWVANPVLVPKKGTNELRMCVDYTGLNKACPKDPFSLPRIDQVIDSAAGLELLCFLDSYSGYHQIKMRKSDRLTTSFTTPYDTFCYVTVRNRQVVFLWGPKATIYSTGTGQICRKPPNIWGKYNIQIYTSNTPPQTHGGSTTLSLESKKSCCALVCAFVKKSANCKSEGTY